MAAALILSAGCSAPVATNQPAPVSLPASADISLGAAMKDDASAAKACPVVLGDPEQVVKAVLGTDEAVVWRPAGYGDRFDCDLMPFGASEGYGLLQLTVNPTAGTAENEVVGSSGAAISVHRPSDQAPLTQEQAHAVQDWLKQAVEHVKP